MSHLTALMRWLLQPVLNIEVALKLSHGLLSVAKKVRVLDNRD